MAHAFDAMRSRDAQAYADAVAAAIAPARRPHPATAVLARAVPIAPSPASHLRRPAACTSAAGRHAGRARVRKIRERAAARLDRASGHRARRAVDADAGAPAPPGRRRPPR